MEATSYRRQWDVPLPGAGGLRAPPRCRSRCSMLWLSQDALAHAQRPAHGTKDSVLLVAYLPESRSAGLAIVRYEARQHSFIFYGGKPGILQPATCHSPGARYYVSPLLRPPTPATIASVPPDR